MNNIFCLFLLASAPQELADLFDTDNRYQATNTIDIKSRNPGDRTATLPDWIPQTISHDCPDCGSCTHNLQLATAKFWISVTAHSSILFGLIPIYKTGYFTSEYQLSRAMQSNHWHQARSIHGQWSYWVQYVKGTCSKDSHYHSCNFGYAKTVDTTLGFSIHPADLKESIIYHEASSGNREHSLLLDAHAKLELDKKKKEGKVKGEGEFTYQNIGKFKDTFERRVSSNNSIRWTPLSTRIFADYCSCGKTALETENPNPTIKPTPMKEKEETIKVKPQENGGKQEEIKMKKSKLADLSSKDTFVYLLPVKDYPIETPNNKTPKPPASFDCFTHVELIDVLVKQNELNRFTVSSPTSTFGKEELDLILKKDPRAFQNYILRIITLNGPVYSSLLPVDISVNLEKEQVDFVFNIYLAVEQLGLAEIQLVRVSDKGKQVLGKRCVLLAAFVLVIPSRSEMEASGKNMDKSTAEKKHGEKERDEATTSGEPLYGFMYHFLGKDLPDIEFHEECMAWLGIVKELEKDGDMYWFGIEAVNVALTPLDANLAVKDMVPAPHVFVYPIKFSDIKSKDFVTSFKILVTEEKLSVMDAALTQLGLKNAPMMRFTVTGKLGFKDREKATKQIVEYVKSKMSK